MRTFALALLGFRPRVSDRVVERSVEKPRSAASLERELNKRRLARVVSDGVLRVGVLSHQHKFKLLSLDSSGKSFIVLVELVAGADELRESRQWQGEFWIRQTAQVMHSIRVASVYWRKERAPGMLGRTSVTPSIDVGLSETQYADLPA